MSKSVALIGECMLELSHAAHNDDDSSMPMALKYGGDTINTAVYMSRAGVNVSYVTALGDDVMSEWLLSSWKQEGIDCSLVKTMVNEVPAMYMINVDEEGERSFLYWRKNSPASRLFDDEGEARTLFESLNAFDYVYLSGISLAILKPQARQLLVELLTSYREQGGYVVFDGNYRPKLWETSEQAKELYLALYKLSDIVLPTLEDENMLFGVETPEQVIETLSQAGVAEAVVKMGGEGCLAYSENGTTLIPSEPVQPVDTTAAGDSFNAGYLSARLQGKDVKSACKAGHALASKVIQFRGAILPPC